MSPIVWVCLVLAACGAGLAATTLVRARRVAPDFGEFFEDLDFRDEQERLLAQPLGARLVGGAFRNVADRLEQLLPANYIAKLDHQLGQAGLASKRKAGEQLAMQLGLAVAGAVMVPFLPAGSPLTGALAWVLLPVMGWMVPAARLKRAIRTRADAIFKDLPDIVDMLAISVEAGSGFESALSIV